MRVDSGVRSRSQYDLPTAITFLLAGLGIGSFIAILFTPRSDSSHTTADIDSRPAL